MSRPQPADPDRKPLAFFVPGEMLLFVEHDQPLAPGALLERLARDPLVAAKSDDHRLAQAVARVSAARVTTTARAGGADAAAPGFLSSVLVDAGAVDGRLRADSGARDFLAFIEQYDSALDAPDKRGAQARAFEQRPDNGDAVRVSAVTLNWLANSAQMHLGLGGPGARPQAFTGSAASAPYRFTLSGADAAYQSDGAGVEIAILDTAPPQDRLAEAYARLAAENPLVYALLGPDGGFALPNRRLRITYDNSQHMRDLNDHTHPSSAGIYGHDYLMSDHGLFAAGIAHTIAPEASLHLVQVLNDWGVGTLETIIRGLESLAAGRDNGRPLVVNLSLMLDIPQPEYVDHRSLPAQFDDWRWFRDWLGARPGFVERSHLPLRRVCEALQGRGALIVAAAGNDGANHVRPPARMPAALSAVIGVGALQKNSDAPASYSNISDSGGAGIATFGGSQDSSGTALAGDGMLGVYIGPLPGATAPNRSGWAWWAGTSFAAPVITAALALLRAAGKSPADALDALYASVAETPGAVEHIFHATQG